MAELQIASPVLQRVYRDCQDRRKGSALPSRRSFDVLDLKYVLGYVNLLDVLRAPLRFRYRVHGTHCVALLGYDMTGKFVDDYPDDAYRARVSEKFTQVVETRSPSCDRGEREIVDGRRIGFEALILPLAADGETVDMLMVALSLA